MKNVLYIAFSLLLITSACEKIDYPASIEPLKLQKSNVRFNYAGGEDEIVVDTDKVLTAILDESGEDWCNISTSGNVVSVTVNENTGISTRHTFVTLSAGGRETELAISQTSTHLKGENITFNCLASDNPLADNRAFVYSPSDLTGVSAEEDVDWINSVTVNSATGTVTVDAEENVGGFSRSGVVKLSLGKQEFDVNVTQRAISVIPSVTEVTIPSTGDETVITFDIPGDRELTAATAVASWCRVNYNNSTKTITVSATVNNGGQRSTTVRLTSDNISGTVTVKQDAK